MEKKWIDNFLRIVQTTRIKLPGYLLKKVGIATHDIVLSVKDENPIVEIKNFNVTPLTKFRPSYRFPDLFILNCSTRKTAITGIVAGIKIPDTNIFEIEGRQESEEKQKAFEWSIDFLKAPEEGIFKEVSVPALVPGKALFVSGSNFYLQLVCKEIIEKYDLSNAQFNYPSEEDEDSRREAISGILNFSEIWIGLILDEREILPFEWSHEEGQFIKRFDYNPIAAA